MSEITTDQVAHLANLARIALTPQEIEKLTGGYFIPRHCTARYLHGA